MQLLGTRFNVGALRFLIEEAEGVQVYESNWLLRGCKSSERGMKHIQKVI